LITSREEDGYIVLRLDSKQQGTEPYEIGRIKAQFVRAAGKDALRAFLSAMVQGVADAVAGEKVQVIEEGEMN
jgi:hypothetical protein